MSKFTKKERAYQNSKPYTFKELEAEVLKRLEEVRKLEIDNKYLRDQNELLKQELERYEVIFRNAKDLNEK